MKRLLSLLSLLLFVAVGTPTYAQGDKPSPDEIWYTSTDGKVVYPNSGALGSKILSNTYRNGKGVIIVEGDCIVKIGKEAFSGCRNLKSITIPDSVTEIGDGAFRGCPNLSSFAGKFATADGRCLIANGKLIATVPSGLTLYSIPDSVTSIGDYAFENCSSLTSITIPDSVTEIGDSAFGHCTSLTSVYITDIAAWCRISFGNVYANPLYYAHNLYLNGELVTNLTIPDSVTSIGEDAFSGCTSLTSITIPDSVTSMGDGAFAYCESLTSITIPDGVTSIGRSAFEDCISLTSVTIPDSVTLIGYGAFYKCTSLTSITIPDGVTSIGSWAFGGCTSLTSITIPDSVTEIGESAFRDCTSLTSITIPDSVTLIEKGAFKGCDALECITIPDSVTEIGRYAFEGCTGELIINSKVVETDYNEYSYPAYYGWLNGAKFTKLTIGNNITSIGDCAFVGCDSLTSITIPDSVTSIGWSAFEGCSSLTSVYITDIAAWCKIAFFNAYANPLNDAHNLYLNGELVTDLIIPDSVTSIGDYAFYNCTSLTSISIPDSVTSIGTLAFHNCSSLTSITIPDSVTEIGMGAFAYCSSLTSITIPASVTEIGALAFSDCTSLTTVYCKSTTPPKAEFYEGVDGYGDDFICWLAFDNGARGCKIYVPKSSVQMYRMSSGWDEFASSIFAEGTMKSQGNELYPIEIYLIPDNPDAEYRAIDPDSIDSPFFDHFYTSKCSWYCGGSVDRVTASSYLSSGKSSYKPEYAHDFDWESAWVEGVSGDGIGQYLLYEFPSGPRVTTVNILNGYVKTSKAWTENSRVKKLKVYYNNTPIAILNLEDSRSIQSFDIGTVGRLEGGPWTLKFEILEVYRGTKYRDTVISEIYFDGIDVH